MVIWWRDHSHKPGFVFFRALFLDYFAWVINLLLSNRNHIHFMLVGKHEGWYIFDQQCLIWWARAAQKWPILVQFWTKNDQTWQAWLFSKGSKMAYLKPILLPFWTIFCPFGPSWPGKHKVYALKQIIIFLEYEEKTFLFVPLGQPYGFQLIPPLISNRGWIMVRLFAVSGLPKFCTFFHFPPSSTRQRRDISTFPDNLMV